MVWNCRGPAVGGGVHDVGVSDGVGGSGVGVGDCGDCGYFGGVGNALFHLLLDVNVFYLIPVSLCTSQKTRPTMAQPMYCRSSALAMYMEVSLGGGHAK
ncbi:unnamed protein product [Echinostoma caproni]|uniref:Uncharacterized protein n=1 Tax=Echinostoma caproni TaxID=27848 RepID=A0A183AGY7_9TREM|nr:unnamed protein product [Echinostoma caproni]